MIEIIDLKNNFKECSSCVKEPTGKVNVARFVEKLDEALGRGDMAEAVRVTEYWEREARSFNDSCGLLSILNEELGLYRRINDKEKAARVIGQVRGILDGEEDAFKNSFSRATVLVNLATTMKAFGMAKEGLSYYDMAEVVYREGGNEKSYEFAALLNNKATALSELGRFGEAESCLNGAIEILEAEGRHDADIALSLVSLAHLYFERDDNAYAAVEDFLDRAWEYINSERNVKDGAYAFAISKCAPTFRYFGREIEAQALEETAEEIRLGLREK